MAVQFPSDRQPRPTTNWCWLLAAAAALGPSREWAGAARGRGGGWGNAPPLPGLMKLTFPSLLQSALSRLLAERGLHVAEIREAAHGAGEQTGWG